MAMSRVKFDGHATCDCPKVDSVTRRRVEDPIVSSLGQINQEVPIDIGFAVAPPSAPPPLAFEDPSAAVSVDGSVEGNDDDSYAGDEMLQDDDDDDPSDPCPALKD